MWIVEAGPGGSASAIASALVSLVVLAAGCTSDRPLASGPQFSAVGVPARATGEVEIVWPGGQGRETPPGEEKLAFAEIAIFDEADALTARGEFVYRVLNADGTLHREIIADITDAVVDYGQLKAWALGVVSSDVKLCSGSGGCDGHDGGAEGGCGGDAGGCGGDDGTTHDGGCSGGGDMGGGDMGGGCTGDDGTTHDDGGCAGSGDMGSGGMGGDCTGGDTGGCSGDGDTGGGVGGVPGNQPRIGQIVVIKLHDKGTPGFSNDGDPTNDDGITWKWFLAGTAPTIDAYATWSHLCKKTIIGGNLTVLPAQP